MDIRPRLFLEPAGRTEPPVITAYLGHPFIRFRSIFRLLTGVLGISRLRNSLRSIILILLALYHARGSLSRWGEGRWHGLTPFSRF